MNKRKGISPSILVFITLLTTSLFLYAYASGAKGPEVSYFKEYTDINKLLSSVTFNIIVPEYVLDYIDKYDVHAENVAGQIVQIDCTEFAFKASQFVHDNADILGLYAESQVDNKYSIHDNNNGIRYFRYRTGYKDYPNTTLINWNTNETTHGIMIANIITEEEALDFIGIDKIEIEKYKAEELTNKIDTNSILVNTYKVGDIVEISLPKFEHEVSIVDNDTYASFYIDNKLLFILEYKGIDSGIEASNSIYNADNICIKYMNNDTENNDTYRLFKENILDIKDSITVLK